MEKLDAKAQSRLVTYLEFHAMCALFVRFIFDDDVDLCRPSLVDFSCLGDDIRRMLAQNSHRIHERIFGSQARRYRMRINFARIAATQ